MAPFGTASASRSLKLICFRSQTASFPTRLSRARFLRTLVFYYDAESTHNLDSSQRASDSRPSEASRAPTRSPPSPPRGTEARSPGRAAALLQTFTSTVAGGPQAARARPLRTPEEPSLAARRRSSVLAPRGPCSELCPCPSRLCAGEGGRRGPRACRAAVSAWR